MNGDEDQLMFSGDGYNLIYEPEPGVDYENYGEDGDDLGDVIFTPGDGSEGSSVSETTGTSEGQFNTPPQSVYVKSEPETPASGVRYSVVPDSRPVRSHADGSSLEVPPKKERKREGGAATASVSVSSVRDPVETRKEKNRLSSALSRQRQKKYIVDLKNLSEDQERQIAFLSRQNEDLLEYANKLRGLLAATGSAVPPLPETANETYHRTAAKPTPPPNMFRPPKPTRPAPSATRGGGGGPLYVPPMAAGQGQEMGDEQMMGAMAGGRRRTVYGAGLCVFALLVSVAFFCQGQMKPEPTADVNLTLATRVPAVNAIIPPVQDIAPIPSLSQRVVMSTGKSEEDHSQPQQTRTQEMSDIAGAQLALPSLTDDKSGLVAAKERESMLPMIPDVPAHYASSNWRPHNVPYLVVNSAEAYTPSKNEILTSEHMPLGSSLGIIVPAAALNISGDTANSLVELYCTIQEANILPAGRTTKPGN